MNIKSIFFLVFSAFCVLQCRNLEHKTILTGNIVTDLNELFQEGTMQVDIMDSVLQSPRENELMLRMQHATEQNKEWYNDYLSQNNTLRVPPYHPNFGLTEKEYNELVQLKLNLVLIPSSTITATISKANDLITFKTQGKIPYLEELIINTKSQCIDLDHHRLQFTDTVFVANENHALKSMWKGYTWRYDELPSGDTTDELLIAKHDVISIGLLYKTGRTLVSISKREDNAGEIALKLDKQLVLRRN